MNKTQWKEPLIMVVSIAGIAIVIVSVWWLQKSLLETNTASGISERSVSMLKTRPTVDAVFQTPCFLVKLPFPIVNPKIRDENGACVLEAKVVKPPVQLVMRASTSLGRLDESSGVQMRLKNPSEYKQIKSKFQRFEESYHFVTHDAVTLFLRQGSQDISVAFTSSGSQVDLDQSDLARLVDSILMTN